MQSLADTLYSISSVAGVWPWAFITFSFFMLWIVIKARAIYSYGQDFVYNECDMIICEKNIANYSWGCYMKKNRPVRLFPLFPYLVFLFTITLHVAYYTNGFQVFTFALWRLAFLPMLIMLVMAIVFHVVLVSYRGKTHRTIETRLLQTAGRMAQFKTMCKKAGKRKDD